MYQPFFFPPRSIWTTGPRIFGHCLLCTHLPAGVIATDAVLAVRIFRFWVCSDTCRHQRDMRGDVLDTGHCREPSPDKACVTYFQKKAMLMGFGVPYFHTNPYRDYSEQHTSEFLRSKQPALFPTDTKSVMSKHRAHNCSQEIMCHAVFQCYSWSVSALLSVFAHTHKYTCTHICIILQHTPTHRHTFPHTHRCIYIYIYTWFI